MDCPQIRELISSYIDKELSEEEVLEFEKHIKSCKDCYDEYLSLLKVVKRINSIEELPLPEDFKEELSNKLGEIKMEESKSKMHIHKRFSNWKSLAAIFVIGVFLSGILLGQLNPFRFFLGARSQDKAAGESGGYGFSQQISHPGASDGELAEREEDYADDSKEIGGEIEKPKTEVSDMQEKIIYSAELSIQVDEFDKAIGDIKQFVKDVKGFIESSGTYDPQYSSRAYASAKDGHMLIRIPSAKFDEAIDKIGEMGKLTNSNISGDNITSQYRDVEVELKNLEIQEERIQEIMKKAENVVDILEIERELNRIRTEINLRKTTIKNWDQLVDYSTIAINIREDKISTSNIEGSPFKNIGLKIQRGFIQSINIIVEGIAKLIVLIAKLIPFILIIAALAFVFKKWIWVRIRKK